MNVKRIVLFASGSGSNAECIIRYFSKNPMVEVICVLTNRRDAPVLDRCNRLQVSAFYFNRYAFFHSDAVLRQLDGLAPDLIVLAGFLWKIPETIIHRFQGKIINIHPALLPKHGGKGMYGTHVHEAVKNSGDTETGITIHYVNAAYDQGAIIEQVKLGVTAADTIAEIAAGVHALEYEHFPRVIEKVLFGDK